MNTAKIYKDIEGNDCTIYQMINREPVWAAVRIQEGEKATLSVEQWEAIAGHIKHLICMYDHVNDDPNKIILNINNVIDDAFGHMPTAIEKINKHLADNEQEG